MVLTFHTFRVESVTELSAGDHKSMCKMWKMSNSFSSVVMNMQRKRKTQPLGGDPERNVKTRKVRSIDGPAKSDLPKSKKVKEQVMIDDLLCPLCLEGVKAAQLGAHFDKCAMAIPFP